MITKLKQIIKSLVLCAALLVIESASAFYDAGLGRWINRDPIGERGFEKLRRADEINMSGRDNPYLFVENSPIAYIDVHGLDLWKCLRDVHGFPGVGNHTYFWDDTGKNGPCSMEWSSGSGPTAGKHDTGPGKPGQDCVKIADSASKADDVMQCCQDNANNGIWFPLINDCHNTVKDCLKASGLPNPKMPRIGKRKGVTVP